MSNGQEIKRVGLEWPWCWQTIGWDATRKAMGAFGVECAMNTQPSPDQLTPKLAENQSIESSERGKKKKKTTPW